MSVLSNLIARMTGDVGAKQYADGATNVEVQLTRQGAIMVADAAGKYASSALAGRLFYACNQTAIATTAALTTTYTGFAMGNPSTSGKNAIILEAGFSQASSADTNGLVGLMVGEIGTTTIAADVTAYNCKMGGASAVCKIDNGTTIGTPVLARVIGSYKEDSQIVGPPRIYDVGGSIILVPGWFVAFYTTLATEACFQFHMIWEEIPV